MRMVKGMTSLEYSREYNKNHKEQIREYRKINVEKMRQYRKKYYDAHKEEQAEYKKSWGAAHKDNNKMRHLKSQYDIDINTYNQMLLLQNNQCSICKCVFTDSNKPHVDHNHETNKVRELLCRKCNFMIGFANEDISILENAIRYIIFHNGT